MPTDSPDDASPASPHAQPASALVAALRHALRPLLRLMLARGITLPWITEFTKSLLVEIAERDFALAGKPPTDSRVSLLTGVHRKDVSRLRQSGSAPAEKMPGAVSLGAQLVARWLSQPPYVDANGQPLPLPRHASEGGEQSFEKLVAGLSSDIRSRVVLDEWQRLGVVHFDDEGRVCLNSQAFVPASGFDEKAFYFGHNLGDHGAAAAHNLLGQSPPFLERSLHFEALGADTVAALAKQAETLGMQALVSLNQAAKERVQAGEAAAPLDATDAGPPPDARRMTFGIYFYSEPAASESPASTAPPAPPAPGAEEKNG